MSSVKLSPRAQSDIEDIWDYTVSHWGIDQAEVYLRQIQAAIKIVANNPSCGKSCDDVRAGYQKFPAGSHLLFYRTTRDGIDIVRILHQRMDFERHL
ncbi:type II toxin-antitoxin system RelE/ParE family toxin [Methyloferula stellata]|uniref:type II toxin-antitoxin system RelE/ParE family toxin n=1 Tax=Methyloferula stellata TaxID=876270 RepID=UPI0003818319